MTVAKASLATFVRAWAAHIVARAPTLIAPRCIIHARLLAAALRIERALRLGVAREGAADGRLGLWLGGADLAGAEARV
jgi:hypothetical protein